MHQPGAAHLEILRFAQDDNLPVSSLRRGAPPFSAVNDNAWNLEL
jgi:hypothetical protein